MAERKMIYLDDAIEVLKNAIAILSWTSTEDAQPEIIRCEDCMHNGSFDTDCPILWKGKEYCSFAERKEDENKTSS